MTTSKRPDRSISRGLPRATAAGLALFVLAVGSSAASAGAVGAGAPTVDGGGGGIIVNPTALVVFGQDTVTAEVARTGEERSRGLMYREELPPDAGMLFIFPDNAVRGFWMQNTYIPLDIAFMDASFRVVDIQQMEPMTTEQHTGRAPFTYALEVNQGWFEAHGVRVGDLARVAFDVGG